MTCYRISKTNCKCYTLKKIRKAINGYVELGELMTKSTKFDFGSNSAVPVGDEQGATQEVGRVAHQRKWLAKVYVYCMNYVC